MRRDNIAYQLPASREYLEVARESKPFDPTLFEELDDDEDYSPEEVEMMRKDDIRSSAG